MSGGLVCRPSWHIGTDQKQSFLAQHFTTSKILAPSQQCYRSTLRAPHNGCRAPIILSNMYNITAFSDVCIAADALVSRRLFVETPVETIHNHCDNTHNICRTKMLTKLVLLATVCIGECGLGPDGEGTHNGHRCDRVPESAVR